MDIGEDSAPKQGSACNHAWRGTAINDHGALRMTNSSVSLVRYGEIFYGLKEATVVIEQRRKHFNPIRPH